MSVFIIPAESIRIPLVDVELSLSDSGWALLGDLLGTIYAQTKIMVTAIESLRTTPNTWRVIIRREWCPRWESWQIDDEQMIRIMPEIYAHSEMVADKELHRKLCELKARI